MSHAHVCFVQRKNQPSIVGRLTVLRAHTQHVAGAAATDVTETNMNCVSSDADRPDNTSVLTDHLYCRTETGDAEQTSVESDELMSSQSSACYDGADSEPLDEQLPSSTSADCCTSTHSVTQGPDVTTQSTAPAVTSDLNRADTEDVSSNDTVSSESDTVSLDSAVSCEVVDVCDGSSVELECQCGAHYSDPSDQLHVVQCERCQSRQHATCVNYDLTDPLRGRYLCPHCHVVEVCDRKLHGTWDNGNTVIMGTTLYMLP